MKKLLFALFLSLCFVGNAYASEDDPIIYYDDFDLDVACGLKSPKNDGYSGKDSFSKETLANFTQAKITSVTDGDTVTAQAGSKSYKVRLIGVDTPETVHPSIPVSFYGKEASNFTKENLTGRYVYLEKDVSETDKYYRSLRYVWLKLPENLAYPSFEDVRDKMFNGILLRDGYATLATFPPDVKYLDHFRKIAKTASLKEIGLYNETEREKFAPNNKASLEITDNKTPSQKENTKDSNTNKVKYVGDGDIPIEGQIIGWVTTSKGSYLADLTNVPIKANMTSGVYHRPGQRDYNKIKKDNVTWFSSAEAAEKAGYRAAKR